ncbi:zinc finger, CCHC-type containing protein [Tanacetum coccineum]
MVLMVEQNHGEHLIHRFAGREEAETESSVWDDGSEDVNSFGGGNPGFHDDHYDNPLLTKETESEPIIWDIGDEEEEYPFVNKYPSFQEEPIMLVEEESYPVYDIDNEEEESMPVYDTDIEDVIEEEEGFVRKGGINKEEDNIEDIVVVANDICSPMIQTTLNVDVEEDINTKSHELMSFGKSIIIKAKKESSDEECLTSESEDKEYAMAVKDFKKFFKTRGRIVRQPRNDKKTFQRNRDDKNSKSERKCFRCGDPNHLIGECPKPSKDKNQRAFDKYVRLPVAEDEENAMR